MAWQADDSFEFRMAGGYALVPGRDGHHSNAVSHPIGTEAYLNTLSSGFGKKPDGSLAETEAVRQDLARWGVDVVVVTQSGIDPRYAVGFLTAVLGRAPRWDGSSWIWSGLGSDPPAGLGRGRLFNCVSGTSRAPLSVPDCVLRSRAPAASP